MQSSSMKAVQIRLVHLWVRYQILKVFTLMGGSEWQQT